MSELDPEVIYQLILESIYRGDLGEVDPEGRTEFQDYLELLPLEYMKISTSNTLLAYFLNACSESYNEAALKYIIDYWSEEYPIELLFPFRTLLYTITEINVETLAYIEEVYDDRSYLQHMLDLTIYDPVPQVETAAYRLHEVYGEQDPQVYLDILTEIDSDSMLANVSNYPLRDIVDFLYLDVSGYAPKPDWVTNEMDELPTHQELMDSLPNHEDQPINPTLPDVDEAVEIMTSSLGSLPGVEIDDRDELKESLYERYLTATDPERLEMIRPSVTSSKAYQLHANRSIFRVLGPAHPMLGWNTLEDDGTLETKYGGSRMFLSYVYHRIDESGYVVDQDLDIIPEWFTGNCDNCGLKIQYLHYAVRMPIEGGAWQGCYCCFDCIRESLVDRNPVRRSLIDNFEILIRDRGIQDREWPSEPVTKKSSATASDISELIEMFR